MHECQWLELEGLLRTSPDMDLLCFFGMTQLQKLQKRAARIITNSSFDAPSRSLSELLGWKTVDELIAGESKTMISLGPFFVILQP